MSQLPVATDAVDAARADVGLLQARDRSPSPCPPAPTPTGQAPAPSSSEDRQESLSRRAARLSPNLPSGGAVGGGGAAVSEVPGRLMRGGGGVHIAGAGGGEPLASGCSSASWQGRESGSASLERGRPNASPADVSSGANSDPPPVHVAPAPRKIKGSSSTGQRYSGKERD